MAEARSFIEQGRFADAERTLIRAVDENPGCGDLLSHLGYFYAKQRRDRRALAVLLKRVEFDACDAGVCRLLADVYQRLGHWTDARVWLNRACELEGGASVGMRFEIAALLQNFRQINRGLFSRLFGHGGFARIVAQAYKALLMRIGWWGCVLIERLRPGRSDVGGDAKSFHLSRYLTWLMKSPGVFPLEAIPYHKCREALFASRWLPIASTNTQILDVGAGKNALPVYWAGMGCDVTAMDGSAYGFAVLRALAEAERERGGEARIRFCQGDATRLPFSEGVFDAVSCICMLEHIPEDGDIAAMREIFRVLRKGGVAVITVESAQQPGERWLEVPYEIGYQSEAAQVVSGDAYEEVFCRDYSPAQIRERLIESADWDAMAESYYDDGCFAWRRWLDPMRGSLLAALMAPLQPLLSLAFFRNPSEGRGLTPSSICCVVLRKS